MPILEITPEMVGPDRTRLALSYIENVMLWPHDPAQRDEAMKTGTACFIQDALAAVPAAKRAVDAADWLDWIRLAADAIPLRLVRQQAAQPFVHGLMAGELLASAVAFAETDAPRKLQSIKSEMLGRYRTLSSHNHFFQISSSTLENTVWKRYKCVSHLWAAHYMMGTIREYDFPCKLSVLPQFLGMAEYFGRWGKAYRPSRRDDPLLDAAEQWEIPKSLGIEPLPVEWKRPPRADRSKGE